MSEPKGAWRDLVTASLIGTERAVVPAPDIPGLPPAGPAAGSLDPAAVLLDRAALLTAARRAGRRPDRAEPLPVAGPDPRPAVSPAAGRRLARILGGEHPDLLAEWLTAAAARGLRPPPQLLPALLDRARRAAPALRRLVAEAGGPRARWLAGLNPDWAFAAAAPVGDDAWRFGDAGQRHDHLAALRAGDPDAARDLVCRGWDAADGRERLAFLAVLAEGLGPADEPQLEAALDDSSDDVRRRAAYLLASLPGSALGQRMTERALRCLRIERDGRLVVAPPTGCDAAMRRDGIAPGPVAGGPVAGSTPLAERTRLVLEVVSRTPLRTWTGKSGRTPATVVAMPSDDYWAPVLFIAWSRAAIAQRDQEWLAVLINRALTGRSPGTAAEAEMLGQLARWADPALGTPEVLPGPDAPPAAQAAIEVLRFRYDMLKELR